LFPGFRIQDFSFQGTSCSVSAARAQALQPFSQGEDLKGEEGSLTRLSSKIYLSTLVDDHTRGGKHLELHQPVCLEHLFKSGVVFGCSTPMLLLNVPWAINADCPAGFRVDSILGISSNKFEMFGMNVNSRLILYVFASRRRERQLRMGICILQ
jgi:hypothetical protein